MEATTVTYIWMGGVIGVMAFYAVIAIAGLVRRK